jgi:membrane-associated protease RseP (regulator of RpoE activity)
MKRKALFAAVATALLSVASANALAQDAPPAPAAAPAVATAPAADVAPAQPAIATAAPAPQADVVVAPAPPAQSGQAAPAAPAEPADMPEPQIGYAELLSDDGNYLGVRVEELTRENAKEYGLSGEPRGVGVTQVLKGSPAERAGLRERDVIVRFDGEAVTSVRKLTRLITESSPDHTARIGVLRGGTEQEVSATLSRRERMAPAVAGQLFGGVDLAEAQRFGEEWAKNSEEWKRENKRLEEWGRDGSGVFALGSTRRIGVTTSTLGKQLADYFGVSHGVLVNSVEQGSPADKAGLRAGDVVTEVEGKQIEDASDLVRALGAKDEGEVTLTVVREKKQRSVRVTPERRQTPQRLFTTPGAFQIAPPVASVSPRLYATPRAYAAPNIIRAPYTLKDPDFITPPHAIAPHVFATPRVRVAPRMTIVKPGGRIL